MIRANSAWWPRSLRARYRTIAVLAAHTAVLVACAPSASHNPARQSPEREAVDSLRAAIGTAHCIADGECRLVSVGAKPCGGPRRYSAFSTTASDTAGVRRWADRLRALERKSNEAEGRVSDCAMVIPPVARCEEGASNPGTRTCSPRLEWTPNR